MITKEKFETYVKIQHSGLTNMFDTKKVVMLSKGILNTQDCVDIMGDYDKYSEEFER